MIRISCTNCKTILSIDDAFAGGVCRCQHCGTIQTVPSQSRTAQVGAGVSKSLYQGDARSGSGLDELAGIVSSGLTSNRLTKRPKQGEQSRPMMMPIIIASTVIVALLLVIIVILISKGSSSPTPSPGATGGSAGSNSTALATNSASFCGTALDGNTIIYLLDCGQSSSSYLGDLRDAAIKSVQSLGGERKFEIIFWANGSTTSYNYPENTTTYASAENITSAQDAMKDVTGYGRSDVLPAMHEAMTQHPDTIVIATGKGFDLDAKWVDDVMAIRGSSPVKIHTFNIGTDESGPLKRLAADTGGSYREVTTGELRNFAQ